MFLGSPRRWARPPNPPLPASTPGSSTTSTLPALTTSTTNPCRLPPALAGSPTPAPRLTLRVKPPTPQPARPPSRAPGPYPSATGPAPGPPLAYLTRPRRPPGPCCLGRSRSPAGENLHAPAPLPRFPAPYRSSSSHPLQPYISSSHPPPLMSARVVSGPAAHLFLLPPDLIAQCNDCTMLSQHPAITLFPYTRTSSAGR